MSKARRLLVTTALAVLLATMSAMADDDVPTITETDRRTAELILPSVLEEFRATGSGLEVLLDLPKPVHAALPNALWALRRDTLTPKELRPTPEACEMGLVYLLRKSPITNTRSLAASYLSNGEYEDIVPALLEALSDEQSDVRLFACQSLMFRKDRTTAPAVIRLLDDPERRVRHTAIRTLGWLETRAALPRIRKLYAEEPKADDDDMWVYADVFARLGDDDRAIRAAEPLLSSENWNVRFFVVQPLREVRSKAIVPFLMRALPVEMGREVDGFTTGVPERTYRELCEQLEERTGAKLGTDAAQWMTWWQEHHDEYGVSADDARPPAGFDDLVRRFNEAIEKQETRAKRPPRDERAGYDVTVTYTDDRDAKRDDRVWSESLNGVRIRLSAKPTYRSDHPVELVLMMQHFAGQAGRPHVFPVAESEEAARRPRTRSITRLASLERAIHERNAITTTPIRIHPRHAEERERVARAADVRSEPFQVLRFDAALEPGTYRFRATYSPTGSSPVAEENDMGDDSPWFEKWRGKKLTTPPIEIRILPPH